VFVQESGAGKPPVLFDEWDVATERRSDRGAAGTEGKNGYPLASVPKHLWRDLLGARCFPAGTAFLSFQLSAGS
jgi:hypothetical protein